MGRANIHGGAIWACFVALFVSLTAPPGQAQPLRILAFGDSLVAGFGLPPAQAFPRRLEQALAEAGVAADIVNGGVSGETSAGGAARIDWVLGDRPDFVIVALGANDALRGLDPVNTAENMGRIMAAIDAAGLPSMLLGMLAPPNLGDEYGAVFNRIYPDLAAAHGVGLYPFFLDGVATVRELNQPDGIHPNAAGVDVIVGRLLPHLIEALSGAGLTAQAD